MTPGVVTKATDVQLPHKGCSRCISCCGVATFLGSFCIDSILSMVFAAYDSFILPQQHCRALRWAIPQAKTLQIREALVRMTCKFVGVASVLFRFVSCFTYTPDDIGLTCRCESPDIDVTARCWHGAQTMTLASEVDVKACWSELEWDHGLPPKRSKFKNLLHMTLYIYSNTLCWAGSEAM